MKAVHRAAPPPSHLSPIWCLERCAVNAPALCVLKISEGCNNRCSFCIIQALRGDLASRPIDDVPKEAERLAKAGVKELLVISQDTSAYGLDLRYQPGDWQSETHEVDSRFGGDSGAY